MRGAARTAAAAAVILLAAGCGTGHGPGPHRVSSLIAAARRVPASGPATTGPVTSDPVTTDPVTTDPVTTDPVTTGPVITGPPTISTAQARRLVRTLLARAEPPPGARPWSGRPPAALTFAAGMQAGRPSAGLHRLWGVPEPASVAYAFESRHAPTGMVWAGSGQGSLRGTVTEQSVSYRLRRLPAGVAAAGLSLTVAPATAATPGSGPDASVLRADAQVIWYPPRSAAEHVPASMHAVEVTVTVAGSRHPRTVTKTVTAPSVVRRLAAMLNRVHAATSGAFSCPMFMASYRITFAVSSRAAPYLVADATTCPDLEITAAGRRQPELQMPDGLLPLLHRLTGVAAQPGGGGTAAPGKPVRSLLPFPVHGGPGTARPLPRVTSVPRA
jgi:hypothetical protein